jgi:hypothetical protein
MKAVVFSLETGNEQSTQDGHLKDYGISRMTVFTMDSLFFIKS